MDVDILVSGHGERSLRRTDYHETAKNRAIRVWVASAYAVRVGDEYLDRVTLYPVAQRDYVG